jgi:hypothetical protein
MPVTARVVTYAYVATCGVVAFVNMTSQVCCAAMLNSTQSSQGVVARLVVIKKNVFVLLYNVGQLEGWQAHGRLLYNVSNGLCEARGLMSATCK